MGLPYAFLELGLYLTTALLVIVILQTGNSCWLYLKAKDLMPGRPESLYEIAYMLMARKSIFLLSATLLGNSFGLVMVYFIVFSKTMKSVAEDAIPDNKVSEDGDGIYYLMALKEFWIVVLGIFVLPICLKRELQDLHIVSLSLFAAVVLFIVILFL